MHLTKSKEVRLHVDTINKTNENYQIIGWVGSTEDEIVDILIDGESISYIKILRNDVSNFYKDLIGNNLGFKISLPKSDANKDISVVLKNSKVIDNVYCFLQRIVEFSGFNKTSKDVIVVDDFYDDPDLVREYTMNNLEFKPSGYHKGQRSTSKFILEGTKEKLEEVIGKKIKNWNYEGYANGVFQFCTADQPIVYHVDTQMYAAMVYLTPDAPPQTGTAMYRSKVTGISSFPGNETRIGEEYYNTFKGTNSEMNFYDGTHFEKIDDVGNVYNRLVIFNSSQIHAATEYFGDAIDNARYFHMFFFDVE